MSVCTKEKQESRKICDISLAPKLYNLETEIIVGGIGDMSIERAMAELLVAIINFWDVKFKEMESNTNTPSLRLRKYSGNSTLGLRIQRKH